MGVFLLYFLIFSSVYAADVFERDSVVTPIPEKLTSQERGEAEYFLVITCLDCKGVPPRPTNKIEAMRALMRAGDLGDHESQHFLSICFNRLSRTIDKDLITAADTFISLPKIRKPREAKSGFSHTPAAATGTAASATSSAENPAAPPKTPAATPAASSSFPAATAASAEVFPVLKLGTSPPRNMCWRFIDQILCRRNNTKGKKMLPAASRKFKAMRKKAP